MTWEQLQNLAGDYGPVVVTAVIVLVVIGVVHKSWPLISNFVAVINALVQLPTLIETVGDIQKEVKPNGGSSMRDVVNLTAGKVDGLDRKVNGLELRFDEHLGTWPSRVEQRPVSIPPSAPRAPRKPRARKPSTD